MTGSFQSLIGHGLQDLVDVGEHLILLLDLVPLLFDLLVYLIQHRDRVVTKGELLEHCWPKTFVSEHPLTRCLAKIRKTIQVEQAGPPFIKTVYGRGYCFVAPVTVLPHEHPLPIIPAAHDDTAVAPGRSKILIVDDELFNVDYLEQELEDLGYETTRAADGQEALQKVAAEAPDLILLDVMMPVRDGLTAYRVLKEHDETRLIPLLL